MGHDSLLPTFPQGLFYPEGSQSISEHSPHLEDGRVKQYIFQTPAERKAVGGTIELWGNGKSTIEFCGREYKVNPYTGLAEINFEDISVLVTQADIDAMRTPYAVHIRHKNGEPYYLPSIIEQTRKDKGICTGTSVKLVVGRLFINTGKFGGIFQQAIRYDSTASLVEDQMIKGIDMSFVKATANTSGTNKHAEVIPVGEVQKFLKKRFGLPDHEVEYHLDPQLAPFMEENPAILDNGCVMRWYFKGQSLKTQEIQQPH